MDVRHSPLEDVDTRPYLWRNQQWNESKSDLTRTKIHRNDNTSFDSKTKRTAKWLGLAPICAEKPIAPPVVIYFFFSPSIVAKHTVQSNLMNENTEIRSKNVVRLFDLPTHRNCLVLDCLPHRSLSVKILD